MKLPHGYEDAARDRKIVPFVGAGFSKNISTLMPNWQEVIDLSAQLLGYESDVFGLHGDHLQLGEYLSIRGKEGALFAELQNRFNRPGMDVAASRPHRLLTYLDTPAIFTTNWDSWIERSFEFEGVPYVKIVNARDFYERAVVDAPLGTTEPLLVGSSRERTLRGSKPTTVVKFHGDFTDHSSIVFAEGKYFDRMEFEDPLDLYLRSEILGRSVLFMGYSFSDRNVRYIWHRLRRMMGAVPDHAKRPSFLITTGGSPVQQDIMKQFGIHLIRVDPTSPGAGIAEVLEQTLDWQNA